MRFISEAPLVLVFCANPSRSVQRFGERSKLFSVQDVTIAAAYAQLAVCVLGLSTVWPRYCTVHVRSLGSSLNHSNERRTLESKPPVTTILTLQ
jgi:hypothetical protein